VVSDLSAIQGPEGKQLVVEAIYLLGALLLMLDRRIDGGTRERSVVAYFRVRGGAQAVGPSISRVISLCCSSGYSPAAKRLPAGERRSRAPR
jgi:Hereditary spastic paraplegia protein strumpellin